MIHVIGDSHVSMFTGLHGLCAEHPVPAVCAVDQLHVVRLGGYLAYSLTRPRHKVRSLLRSALDGVPKDEPVVLVFGEIDCRNHVVPHAKASARRPEQVGRDLAVAYARAARKLVGPRPLGLWAVTATMAHDPDNAEYPVRGTLAERCAAARGFNRTLQLAASGLDAKFLTIESHTAHRDGTPNAALCADGVHADPRALPLACEQLIATGWPLDSLALRAQADALSRVPPPSPVAVAPLSDQVCWSLVDRAALHCRTMGVRSIALYGAGAHTQRIGLEPYASRGLRVRAIIDDAPRAKQLLGLPVVKPDALPASVQGIVISSDGHERSLFERARANPALARLPILRIYNWVPEESPRSIQPGRVRAKASSV